ncbi:conserved protein, unknown function, partial [Hepatocystis sp. ex Piliocolobus tephrosceles]
MKNIYDVTNETEKTKNKKISTNNLSEDILKNKNILKKQNYGYEKLKNKEIDIMSYLKVKMNDNDNEEFKKEEKENIFINQIVKKLYLTNFKLNKEYYEPFGCFKKYNLKNIIEKKKKKNKKKNSDFILDDFVESDHDNDLVVNWNDYPSGQNNGEDSDGDCDIPLDLHEQNKQYEDN